MPRDGTKNLKPRTSLSHEEASAMGKRSGEVRRQKAEMRKSMKETLDILLRKSLKRGTPMTAEQIQDMADVQDKNVDVITAMAIATIQRALLGDIQATQFVRDTIGEKPSDKVEVDQSLTIESWAKSRKVKL